jgi:hypothetical protein
VRKLSDAQRAALALAVEQLAWTAARELPEFAPDAVPQREWLAVLTTLQVISDSAEQLAASAALSAARHHADYPAIGDAAETTRQGAKRRWPGLTGLSEERRRKLDWWQRRGAQLAECVEAVLATAEEHAETDRLEGLRTQLAELAAAAPAQRVDLLDTALLDAHAIALRARPPAGAAAALAIGLLSALAADAYATTNTQPSAVAAGCSTPGCPAGPVLAVLVFAAGWEATPVCRAHAVEALRHRANRIVLAYEPEVALSVFTEVHGTG